MTDWSTYDTIADRYDDVWGARFETVARLVWDRLSPLAGARILDVGTGTGIVPRTLDPTGSQRFDLAACDRSVAMLRVARSRTPALRLAAAQATSLPFVTAAFDVVTASFVLSHLVEYDACLAEVRRLLKPGGRLAVTAWGPVEDAPSREWSRLLAGVVSKEGIDAAVARVAPSEACFERPPGLERALTGARFASVAVQVFQVKSRLSVEQFADDRALSSSGRYARHVLGEEEWRRFVVRAADELHRQFGPAVTLSRGVLIGTGQRPA